MLIRQYAIDGLGHLSTFIADEDHGVAAVVDPRRDVDVYLALAAGLDLRITHVLETHLHNDYVSGGHELAALTGAQHVIGAGARLAHEHRPVAAGDHVSVGALEFTVHETPGHTPEHVAYSVADKSRASDPALLFTGGSLLVGAVGRTDLLGEEDAVAFAHAMHSSLRDVVFRQPDHVTILPTHGAGSLCSTGISSTPSSTIGFERLHNRMAGAALVEPADIDGFVRTLLSGQPAVPRYFARMRPTNQAGPALLGPTVPAATPLDLPRVKELLAQEALVVDARSPMAFALAHVPGSVSIPAGSSFSTWLGWVTSPDRPIVMILESPADWDTIIRQALRIGFESVIAGHLQGGFGTWTSAGSAVESTERLTVQQLAARLDRGGVEAPLVIDVRQASEYESGHIPDAWHIGAGDLTARLAELPRDRPIAAMCESGYRASVASSLLRQAGFTDVAWVATGVSTWRHAGFPIERGIGGTPASPLAVPAHSH
ncbi:MAG TPA: rhodanese-like domain-containing protein [Candidatus Acidoferrum sp.]|nr:rhodanese-like domain-containing protein [Candidatus Acidoferrum sp.]